MPTVVRRIFDDLKPSRSPSRALYVAGAFCAVSATVHTVMLGLGGFRWEGAVSWRKPIVFGLSFGLLLATVGWILDRLPDRRRLASGLAWTLIVSSSIEVGLITVRAWRGEASHFNTFEPTNALIFAFMGGAVLVLSICLVATLVWSIRRRPENRLVSRAILAGMAMVTMGLGIGQWLIELGTQFVERYGLVPDTLTYGAAGTPKFPHAIAFHGIQLFIVVALALSHGSGTPSAKSTILWSTIVSYAGILVFAMVQAVVGASPAQPTVWNLGLLVSAAALGSTLLAVRRASIQQPVDAERAPVAVK
jgi:hypothetical protein